MGHILIVIGKVFLVVLLSAATIAGIFHLSSTFTAHALYMRTEIKADPPGIAKIIYGTGESPSEVFNPDDNFPTDPDTDTDFEGTSAGPTPPGGNASSQSTSSSANKTKNYIPPGQTTKGGGGGGGGGAAKPKLVNPKSNRGTLLTINTPIYYGLRFPGETATGNFTICLTDSDFKKNTHDPTQWVIYKLVCEKGPDPGDKDLCPYLTFEKKETDAVTDNATTSCLLQDDIDECDTWLVQLNLNGSTVPETGDYHTIVTVVVIAYEGWP